jgi:hypothetical protein
MAEEGMRECIRVGIYISETMRNASREQVVKYGLAYKIMRGKKPGVSVVNIDVEAWSSSWMLKDTIEPPHKFLFLLYVQAFRRSIEQPPDLVHQPGRPV